MVTTTKRRLNALLGEAVERWGSGYGDISKDINAIAKAARARTTRHTDASEESRRRDRDQNVLVKAIADGPHGYTCVDPDDLSGDCTCWKRVARGISTTLQLAAAPADTATRNNSSSAELAAAVAHNSELESVIAEAHDLLMDDAQSQTIRLLEKHLTATN